VSDRYARSCAGKKHYNSKRRADEAAKSSQILYGITMNAYACPFHPGKFCVGTTHPWEAKTARRENGLAEHDI